MPKGQGNGEKWDQLQQAVEDAWKDYKKNGGQPGEHEIKIYADCSNPVDGYKVVIGD